MLRRLKRVTGKLYIIRSKISYKMIFDVPSDMFRVMGHSKRKFESIINVEGFVVHTCMFDILHFSLQPAWLSEYRSFAPFGHLSVPPTIRPSLCLAISRVSIYMSACLYHSASLSFFLLIVLLPALQTSLSVFIPLRLSMGLRPPAIMKLIKIQLNLCVIHIRRLYLMKSNYAKTFA